MPRAEAASTSAVTACRLSHCISCRGAFSCGVLRMSQQVDMCSGASYCANLANDLTAASLLLHVPGELPLGDPRPGRASTHLSARLLPAPDGADIPALALSHGREWAGTSVLLDASACGIDANLGGRLWVDSPHPGDVLCPLGMHGQSKKVSDLLNEARIPAAERPLVPVVRTSPTGPVVWVAGIRADERARCTPRTSHLLELSLRTA